MNRIRAGYCLVPNPFNARQIGRISLDPDDVDAIVFWTRNARPLLPHLDELDGRGFRYYFQQTITGYDRRLEPHVPHLEEAIASFRDLSVRVGPERVVWRYDPIILSNRTSADYHLARFAELAAALQGATARVMVSFATYYRKTVRRLAALEAEGFVVSRQADQVAGDDECPRHLLGGLAAIARARGLDIYACASEVDYTDIGVAPGRCVDGELIKKLWGIDGHHKKDPGQRKACGCAVSRDIGVNDTCLHGCVYCYATRDDATARRRHGEHDAEGEALWKN